MVDDCSLSPQAYGTAFPDAVDNVGMSMRYLIAKKLNNLLGHIYFLGFEMPPFRLLVLINFRDLTYSLS